MVLVLACRDAGAAEPAPPARDATVEPIVVTGERLSVETRIDRKVYSVATDVQATFGTVSDILSAIPSVDIDPDGNVSLRGEGNVLILIDGKPSTQFSGSAAGESLQSISARDIERIEVITTPPAQFKADGAGGVINIITRKRRPQGLAGSLQGSVGSGGREVSGANASFGSGPLNASATAGLRHDYRQRRLESNVSAPDPTTAQLLESASRLDETIHRQAPSVGISVDYALDDRQSVSGSSNWSRRGGLRTYTQRNLGSTPSGALTSDSQRRSAGHDPETNFDQRLEYSRKPGPAGEELDISLHRSTSHQREHYDYTNDSLLPAAPRSFNNLNLLEDRATSELGADYALPISGARSLKFGIALERDDFRYGNAGNNVDPVTGVQTVDPAITNDFQFRQDIIAGYASYQHGLGAWNGLAGLRAETTRTEARQLTDRSTHSGRYLRVYPSLHLDRSLSDQATISFAAGRRVTRPDPGNLDPYVDHEYTPNLRAGNADLQPQYTESYEAGYGVEEHGLSCQLTGYFRRNRDSVTDVTRYLGNGFSLTTKENLPRNDAEGLEFAASGHLAPKLGVNVNGNLFHSQIDASALGTPGLRSTTGVNAKLKLDYHPTAVDSAQLIVTRLGRRLTPQGYISAINIVNAGYREQWTPDLTAVLTVSDIFHGQRYERIETTPAFAGDYRRMVRGRVLYLGLVYSFGSARKDRQQKFEFDQAE